MGMDVDDVAWVKPLKRAARVGDVVIMRMYDAGSFGSLEWPALDLYCDVTNVAENVFGTWAELEELGTWREYKRPLYELTPLHPAHARLIRDLVASNDSALFTHKRTLCHDASRSRPAWAPQASDEDPR